ncbi:TonB-linked outer membrane protein, SusC/RagA family [bacterium A37T11]|nr:TonB-linked outer membrane protein, SusC/RagA family [bacterium A37T11]
MNIDKLIFTYGWLLVSILGVGKGWAQNTRPIVNSTLEGRVIDSLSKDPLPGATVQIAGVTHKVQTDGQGLFRIVTGQKFPYKLVISFIGYKTKEIQVQKGPVEIFLSGNNTLEDVVVVGYGTQKRRAISGAVGSLQIDKDISARTNAEFGQALYGKVAGVQVLSNSGRPGNSSTVQIRGINSASAGSAPLIVVDGIPIPNYDLNLINSADIESIDILKDAASAAIYGSRGANGVILVTTKGGGMGATRVNIDYSGGFQHVIDKVDVMNSSEYAQAAIDAAQNGWIESGGDPNAPNTIEARGAYKYTWPVALEHPETLPNTDFQDAIFRTAPVNKLGLNVTGGSDKSTFLFSGGYQNQQGIALTSNYQKYNATIKNVTKLKDWLQIGASSSFTYDHEREPYSRMFEWAVQYPSIYPLYSSNGYLGSPNNQAGFEKYNAILFRPQNGHPLYRINDNIQHNRLNVLGSAFAEATLLPGLTYRTALNYFFNRKDNSNYQAVDHNLGSAYYTQGVMTVDQSRIVNYTFQNLLSYQKKLGAHDLAFLLGYEYNNNDLYYTDQERRGYDNDLVQSLAAGKTVYEATDDKTKTVLISYFARANYDFKNKYLLSASLRRDGSSRFAPHNKWGYFPAVSAGWVVSEEPFLKAVTFINNLKLRASYGLTGNDNFDDYKWIGAIAQGRVAFGNNLSASYYPSSITNRDLKWERTKQLDLGLDLSLWHGRVSLEADWYHSTSDGLLLDVPVPVVSGFTTAFKNVGKLQNKGVELALNTQNLVGKVGWSSQVTFSLNRNRVLALGDDNAPMILSAAVASGMQKINEVGQPIFNFYGYRYLGVYKNQAEIDADPAHYATAKPGDGRYQDVSGNGVLGVEDRTIIGNPAPDFVWGFTNKFTYGQWDLSVLLQGVQGGEVMDENIHRSTLYHEGRNYYKEVVNRWRSEQDPGDGYHYKLTVDLDGYEKTPSSYWLRSASYLRVKSLTLGYNFPQGLMSRIKLSSLRVFLNGTNLFTHKDSPVVDPETFSSTADNAAMRGVSSDPYPTAKVYSFGIQLGL